MGTKDAFQCIDPGLRACGFADFRNEKLAFAVLVKGQEIGRGPAAHKNMAMAFTQFDKLPLYIEFPEAYPGMPKTDHNDLLEVAGTASAVASTFPEVTSLRPKEWKGNIPKKTMTARIYAALTDEEKKVLPSKDHNILDAVGIGLFVLGRLNKRVIAYD